MACLFGLRLGLTGRNVILDQNVVCRIPSEVISLAQVLLANDFCANGFSFNKTPHLGLSGKDVLGGCFQKSTF